MQPFRQFSPVAVPSKLPHNISHRTLVDSCGEQTMLVEIRNRHARGPHPMPTCAFAPPEDQLRTVARATFTRNGSVRLVEDYAPENNVRTNNVVGRILR